ncbi:hypothetical protein ACI75Y_12625 [Capnocytophaga stomatis]|uniref:hypothetical protein n=1 Tax=Capnocytophaga stomatis TaxID=1848904 RepID=UPI00385D7001
MPGTDNLNNDFTQEEKDLFDAHLSSTEAQKVEQEQEEELQAQQDKLIVVDGARYRFGAHLAELKVLNDTPTIQGKLVGTVVENQPTNFTFADGFQLTSLGQWTGQGTAKFQNNEALIQGSKITFAGQMPGSNTVETGTATCIHSGQINVVESIDTAFGPFPPYKTPPKILSGWWSEDKNGLRDITQAALEDTVYFVIETAHIADGEKLSVQLYDYDCFMWVDFLNRDDKIENPKQVRVKNNRAVIEVYLKPEWKKHIDDDKGYAFNLDESVDLYWEVRHDKAKTKTLPTNEKAYLKVKNNRTIYIKPVMSETGYNYGVPEIYSFEGDPMFFADISDIIELPENEENEYVTIIEDEVKNEIRNQIISKSEEKIKEKADAIKKNASSKKVQPIALTRVDKVSFQQKYKSYADAFKGSVSDGKCAINGKKISLHHDYFSKEQAKKQRTANRKNNIVFQKTFYESTPLKAKALYVAKDALNIFGDMYDLVQAASSTKSGEVDITSGIITTALGTNFLGGLLVNITLNILNQPLKEFMAEGLERDKKELDKVKFWGKNDFIKALNYNTFLKDIYKTKGISYQTMQGLLKGTIKKVENLKSAYEEVTIVFKEVEDGILIDTFFVNTEKR